MFPHFSVALHKQSHVCVQNENKQTKIRSYDKIKTLPFFFFCTIFHDTLEAGMKGFVFTHEVDTVGHRHRDSGPVGRPGPRQACPSADWGGSDRTPPYQVWDYTLGTAALSKIRL